MQVSRTQASRAVAAARRRQRRAAVRRRTVRPRPPAAGAGPRTVELALRAVEAQPRVRVHLVAAATARLAAGERPSSEAVADMAIRRALCDRVR